MLKQHRMLIPLLVLVALIFAIVAGYFLSLPQGDELAESLAVTLAGEPDNSEAVPSEGITPMGNVTGAGTGIPQDAIFTVTSGFSVKEEQLRELLEVEPTIGFQLSGNKKEWALRPNLPLSDNTIYTFRVKNTLGQVVQSFAFQTKGDLLINNVFPRDTGTGINVDTGIEVRFNQTGVDLSSGFEILPPVPGRFETQDYFCRFIPDRPLEHNSIYRVTIKQGLKAPSGAILTKDYHFFFETQGAEGEPQIWGNLFAEKGFQISCLPGDPMEVLLTGGEDAMEGSYDITLHKFPGINAYAKELRAHETFYEERYGTKKEYVVSTDGLDEIMNVNGKLLIREDYAATAPLPENLAEGYYVFTLKGKDAGERPQLVQQLIQVVNLSLYAQSSDGDSLFWVNDPVTKGPVAAAGISLEGVKTDETHQGETEEDGRARILTGEMESAYLTITREGTTVYFDRVNLSPQGEQRPLEEQYYAALYTDRSIYRPGDLIHVWGMVKPRRITATMPEEVYASLGSYWSETELHREKFAVKADGTFNGTINPGNIRGDSYRLAITDGKNPYVEHMLPVENYTKPAYEITLSTDRDLYDYKEEVRFSVKATYYDGTPVAGGELLVNCFEAGLNAAPLTLDNAGQGTLTGRLNPEWLYEGSDVPSWEPQSVYWDVSSADGQDMNLYESHRFWALPSKIAAKLETSAPGELTISTAVIDETKVGEVSFFRGMEYDPFEQLRGVPADIPVTVIVHKTTTRQTQTSTAYDYVNKKNIPVYQTKWEDTIAQTVNATVTGGKVLVKDLPFNEYGGGAVPLGSPRDKETPEAAAEEDIRYSYEVRFAGGVHGDVNVLPNWGSPRWLGKDGFAFLPGENGRQKKVGLEEELELGLYSGDEPVQIQGNVLFTLVQRGMLTSGIYGREGTSINMEEDFLPNVYLAGAYFDGRHTFPIERLNLCYEYTPRTLTVEAVPDQESYRPGDSVTVTLSVKDQQGAPVKASVVVGVVDESIFALYSQAVDLAEQLYHSVYSPRIVGYTSTSLFPENLQVPMNTGGGGIMDESGVSTEKKMLSSGGKSGDIRNLFADTAAFETVETDENGQAKVTLILPDNITSWRITAAGITADLKAGDSVSNTVATKPFYLQTVVTNTYLEGDDISFTARGVGQSTLNGAEPSSTVAYNILVQDGAGTVVDHMEKTGAPNTSVAFNLGKYEAGSYRVTLSGKWGEYTDGVELPFAVAKSTLVVPQIINMPLDQLPQVKSALYPVRITVMDEQMKPCLDVLSSLSRENGEHTELILASYGARVIYESLLPEKEQEMPPWDSRLDDIQTEEGGIRLLPNGGPDPALTAKILMSAPELIQAGGGVDYLRTVLQDASATPDDRIMAYVGLAAAKEPVLLDLTRMLKGEESSLTPAQKLYIGAAFAKLGDYTTARRLYEECAPLMKIEGGFRYLEGDGTEESRRQTTAAALLLTAVSAHEDAPSLAKFFLEQEHSRRSRTDSVLCQMELLAFAKAFAPEITRNNPQFTFNDFAGQSRVVTLEPKQAFSVTMSAEALAKASFKSVSGKLYASVLSFAAGETVEASSSGGKLTVEKTYTPMVSADGAQGLYPDGTAKVSTGGRIRVTIRVKFDPSAPVGRYTLTDVIPAGFRYLPGDSFGAGIYSPISNDGQTITTNIYRLPPKEETLPVGRPHSDTEETVEAKESILDSVEEEPVADSKIPPDSSQNKEETNAVTVTYYISAALPGSFITESAYVTPHIQDLGAGSGRGILVVEE